MYKKKKKERKERKDPTLYRSVLGSQFALMVVRVCVAVCLHECLYFFNTHIRIFFLDRLSEKIFMRDVRSFDRERIKREKERDRQPREGYEISFIFILIVRRCNVCMAKCVI